MARRVAILLLVVLALASLTPAPVVAAPLPQVAPCATAAAAAIAQRGKPYVWGAKGPSAFDCSGLTQYAWAQAGYRIGVSTHEQVLAGVQIPCRLSHLAGSNTTCWEPGDLIFLRNGGRQHVAMYVGNGLFADAYNQATGVVIHRVEIDSYYQAHYWQSRRIVDCDGVITNPGTPDTPDLSGAASLEDLPDLLPSVLYRVPQCGSCDPNGVVFMPPTEWGETWPRGWETLNPTIVFQKAISWLAWQIREIVRQLICWLFTLLQILLDGLSLLINALLISLNAIWKTFIWTFLALRAFFYSLWEILEWMRLALVDLQEALGELGPILTFLWEIFLFIGQLIGQLLNLLWLLLSIILGVVGWIGGLLLGIWLLIVGSLTQTTIPVQLTGLHPVYWMVRGGGEAIRDSDIGWMYWLVVAAFYVGSIFWAARFLSAGKDSA